MPKNLTLADLVKEGIASELELQLSTNPDLPKRFGKQIKACGGRYKHARGYDAYRRFVVIPLSETQLIDNLVDNFGTGKKTTVILRGGISTVARFVVFYIPKGVSSAAESLMKAFEPQGLPDALERLARQKAKDEKVAAEKAARDYAEAEAVRLYANDKLKVDVDIRVRKVGGGHWVPAWIWIADNICPACETTGCECEHCGKRCSKDCSCPVEDPCGG